MSVLMPCYSSPPWEFLENAEFLNTYLQKFRLLQQTRYIQLVPVRALLIVILDLPINPRFVAISVRHANPARDQPAAPR